MTAYEIPLIAAPQSFTMALAGVSYQLTVWFNNDPAGGWILDIADNTGNSIIDGIPLVTSMDLLAQYAHLGIGGSLFVQTDHAQGIPPTFENLGSTSHLYFVTTP